MTRDPYRDLIDALDLSLWQKLRLRVGVPVMKDILTRFWTDPAYFTGLCRGVVVALVAAVLKGDIVLPQPYESWVWGVVPYLVALGAVIPAGQSNPSPGTLKAIVANPGVTMTDAELTTAAETVTRSEAAKP